MAPPANAFTPEQLESYRSLFDQADVNRNGDIDAGELYAMLTELQMQVSMDDVTDMLNTIDKDGTGSINWDEFLLLMYRYSKGGVESDDDDDDVLGSPSSAKGGAGGGLGGGGASNGLAAQIAKAVEENDRQLANLAPEEMALKLKMLLNMKDMLRDAFDPGMTGTMDGDLSEDDNEDSFPSPGAAAAAASGPRSSSSGGTGMPSPSTNSAKKGVTVVVAQPLVKKKKKVKLTRREKQVQFVIDGLTSNDFQIPQLLVSGPDSVAAVIASNGESATAAVGPPGGPLSTTGNRDAAANLTKREDGAETQARNVLDLIGKVAESLEQKLSLAVDYVEVGVDGFEDADNIGGIMFGGANQAGGDAGGVDPATTAVDLEELQNFTFAEGQNTGAAQGSDAFKLRAKDFPFFMFPIDMVCDQLDVVKERFDLFTHSVGLNEYLLRPRCPDGSTCKLRRRPEHRLKMTHPCYAGETPCPHSNGKMHMRCYTHGDEAALADKEQVLKEFQKLLGVLDITGFEIGDCGAQCLAFVLKKDLQQPKEQRLFRDLRLAGNHFSPSGAIPLIDFAVDLVKLDLSSNGLGYRGSLLTSGGGVGPSLHQLLLRGERLTHLNLSRNRLCDNEMRYIARGVKENTILRHLDLRKNEFGPGCGEMLASAMSDNRYLAELLLGWNRLEAAGSMDLLLELSSSSTVELLDLSWTGVTEEGGKLIAQMIAGSTALIHLDVSHNGIGRQSAPLISKAIQQSRTLQHLDLSFNPLGDRGVTEIVRDLKENFVVETLDLRSTKARDEVQKDIQATFLAREPNMPKGVRQKILFEKVEKEADGSA